MYLESISGPYGSISARPSFERLKTRKVSLTAYGNVSNCTAFVSPCKIGAEEALASCIYIYIEVSPNCVANIFRFLLPSSTIMPVRTSPIAPTVSALSIRPEVKFPPLFFPHSVNFPLSPSQALKLVHRSQWWTLSLQQAQDFPQNSQTALSTFSSMTCAPSPPAR